MNSKIKALKEMCSERNLNLVVKYYDNREVCFIGLNEDDDEEFDVAVWHRKKERNFHIEINSQYEKWKGGQFTKDEILLLLSIDDLSDEELNIKPQEEENE